MVPFPTMGSSSKVTVPVPTLGFESLVFDAVLAVNFGVSGEEALSGCKVTGFATMAWEFLVVSVLVELQIRFT